MSTWQEFYNEIKDPAWPDCATEEEFTNLSSVIQKECTELFGYRIGQFKKISKLPNRVFPIMTATACQLKWNWSTVYLTTENTASCHRTNHHKFDTNEFNFHNTPQKLNDREHMLKGEWPDRGCEYCKNIERAGGASDRITNLDFPGIHAPLELDLNPTAIRVTPRILEVYFDNTCNLKCLYCGPHFSSLWDAENIKFGGVAFKKSTNIEANKQKIFDWIRTHGHQLAVFNILGGEPLYQRELEQCLDVFDQYPAPELKLQIFTNLNCKLSHLQKIVERIKQLIDQDKLREFEVTASLDCWGPEQEYVRFPLDLQVWEENFNYLVEQKWINLIVSSTITPLTIKTLPDLLERIQQWSKIRPVYHYQNSINNLSHLFIDIFGNMFDEDFARALALKPTRTPEEIASREYLQGIARQAASGSINSAEITKLYNYLTELDRRRNTDWATTFPWLVSVFKRHILD